MNIRIIVDSASDMMGKEREHLTVVPMTVTFGEKQYLDGVELSPAEFYEKLIEGNELPTTSQVSPYAFEEAISKAIEAGETPIVITVTSKLSGTYNSARIASLQFDEKVYLVDSENVCAGEQILVEYALRLIEEGKNAEEIVEELEGVKKKICVVAFENAGGVDYDMPYALAYSGLDDTAIQKYIRDNEHIWKRDKEDLNVGIIGSTIGTHAGPGAIAAAFFRP